MEASSLTILSKFFGGDLFKKTIVVVAVAVTLSLTISVNSFWVRLEILWGKKRSVFWFEEQNLYGQIEYDACSVLRQEVAVRIHMEVQR